jgi:hypothetical protein
MQSLGPGKSIKDAHKEENEGPKGFAALNLGIMVVRRLQPEKNHGLRNTKTFRPAIIALANHSQAMMTTTRGRLLSPPNHLWVADPTTSDHPLAHCNQLEGHHRTRLYCFSFRKKRGPMSTNMGRPIPEDITQQCQWRAQKYAWGHGSSPNQISIHFTEIKPPPWLIPDHMQRNQGDGAKL